MASSSSPPAEDPKEEILKKVRSHEIAIGELNSLAPSRSVYQRNGNIFFRRSIKTAVASEQKQLETAKAQLPKLNTV